MPDAIEHLAGLLPEPDAEPAPEIEPAFRLLAIGQGFRGDRTPEVPIITAPYKHAALAARLVQQQRADRQRQRDFHLANSYRKAPQ